MLGLGTEIYRGGVTPEFKLEIVAVSLLARSDDENVVLLIVPQVSTRERTTDLFSDSEILDNPDINAFVTLQRLGADEFDVLASTTATLNVFRASSSIMAASASTSDSDPSGGGAALLGVNGADLIDFTSDFASDITTASSQNFSVIVTLQGDGFEDSDPLTSASVSIPPA